ncbi:efflux RND transporter periplasmic adaptor subunit [Methylomonas sp. EFPC1]|uniref:efflux RND transporter periplasmic adaptor subunit n=1 Tax=Methylomonas sp. EFPC1 TaxID=2812647 RepID=UPI00196893D7|nr:efflux RND transporter periplasmic adaptor subunit [Methylomonas sp. EFPC1]QSB02434.1 efflux RND transporter periplasmic adaptor subunit [Methylomonas sp. EFPC1]
MNTSVPTFTKISLFCCCVLAAQLLSASSDSADPKPAPPKPPTPVGEVVLAPDSPKKAYVKTAHLTLSQHPLLEPLAGKIVYDESLTSRISSPVSGRVVTAPIALGSPVQTGSTLLELDSPDVADAEADFAKAQAAATLANHAFNRQQELYAGKAISRKELEQAQSDLSSARSDLQRATDRLKNLHLSARQADGRFALRATLPGIVVERNVNPGMEVRPDLDTPLFVVSDLKHLTVLLEVFEVNIGKIKLGQQVAVSVPAYPGVTFPATVQYIGQVLDETTRTVQVRCKLDNPDGRLLPGMYATISVESAADDKAFVIPLTAVFTEGDADYVFTAFDDNRYRQRRIEIGLRLKDQAVITQGLDANELLVTEGALMLRAEEEVETESTHQP